MAICKLDIYAVRNILKETILPAPTMNFIVGENASGKSAIIEAIFILGRAKSYRSTSIKPVINFDQNLLIVSGQILGANGGHTHIGIQLDSKSFCCRINQQTIQKKSELAYALPLQIIHPKSYELLDSSPQYRREFLDWGVFNHNENFLMAWRNFKKALLQRNAILKSKDLKQLNVWDKEIVYYGTIVNNHRQSYLEKFKPVFLFILNHFLTIDYLDLKIIPGWNTKIDFEQALADDLTMDLRYGFTHSGPHRADIQLLIGQRLAKDVVSRGQLKLLVLSLKIAQVQLLADEQGSLGCFLIDDFAAELDANNRAKILHFLSKMGCQVFITATEITELGDISDLNNYKVFHVEQGIIRQV